MIEQSLLEKRVVITGAGRGLGRAMAIVLADCGANVVLLGRDSTMLKEVADAIKVRTARPATAIECDLSQPNSIANACDAVLKEDPTVDVLINNGAPWLVGDLEALSDDAIISNVAATVTGTILVTKGLLPGLCFSNAADVVTIVSTCGFLGWDVAGASVPFYASKHGQSGFNDRLRVELKSRNIRVTGIYPPDFEDIDPLSPAWPLQRSGDQMKLSNREVTETVLFTIMAPRSCNYPIVVMDGMHQ